MVSFNKGGKRSSGGFNRGFSGNRSFVGRPNMHKATCDECGESCEVPFKPTGDKPVFCSNCFGKQGGRGGERPNKFGGERREKFGSRDRQMHNAVCSKCGKACQVPFRPTSSKPVFCNDCFGKDRGGERGGGRGSNEVLEQIKMLNAKLDKLVEILDPKSGAKKEKELETKPKKNKAKDVPKKTSKKSSKKAVAKKKK